MKLWNEQIWTLWADQPDPAQTSSVCRLPLNAGSVSDSTFSSTLFIQHQSTTTVTLRCFTLQVTTVISLSDAGCVSITGAEPDALHKWSLELDSEATPTWSQTQPTELLPAAADLEEYGNDRRLFIYILICIYEAISLMLSLVCGLKCSRWNSRSFTQTGLHSSCRATITASPLAYLLHVVAKNNIFIILAA